MSARGLSARGRSRGQAGSERIAVLMRNARRWMLAARLAEGLLLGVAVWLAVLTAAVLAGKRLAVDGAQAAALVAGLAAGAGYFLGERVSMGTLVRGLDAKLGQRGELATAWEHSLRAAPSDLARLLAANVSARLPRRRVLQASSPHSLPFVALPLLACAALALARGSVGEGGTAWTRDLAQRLAEELRTARVQALDAQDHGHLERDELQSLFETEELARELSARWNASEGAASGPQAPDLQQMRELRERLEELAAQLDPTSDLARSLERACSAAQSAELALESEAREAPREPARAPGSMLAAGESEPSDTAGASAQEDEVSSEERAGERAVEPDRSPGEAGRGEYSAPPPPAPPGSVSARGPTLGALWHARDADLIAAWTARYASLQRPDPASKEGD